MRRKCTITVLFLLALLSFFMHCSPVKIKDKSNMQPDMNAISDINSFQLPDDSLHGGELVITSGAGSPKHLNPALMSGFAAGLAGTQIFASPLRYDENWNPRPYLAESWEISEDGLSVTLHLVKNAAFHDGHMMTSEDVAFSLNVVKTYHPFKSMFDPVETVETPDQHTVVIKLKQTHPAILLAMSPPLLPVLPKHIYDDGKDILNHPANLLPTGCGPYLLKTFIPGEYIILEKNKNYFIKDRPFLDRIIIHMDSDPVKQMVKMERGEAHLMPLFSNPDIINKMSTLPHLSVTARGYEAIGPITWLAFNLLRPPVNNKDVRKAIAYAIDRDFITQYLHDSRSQPAIGPFAPNSPFFENMVHVYDFDIDKANELLDKAGYPIKSNNYRFSITCDYIPLAPSQQKEIALYLKRQLREIGIDIHVRESDNFVQWTERISNWDFDMTMDLVFNWGDPVIGVHRTYMSDNIRKGIIWSNTQNYKNPYVDAILEEAGKELDPDKRKLLYSKFQKILTDELPIIWINVTPFHTIYNSKLKILPTSIWGLMSPFDDIYWKQRPEKPYYHPKKVEKSNEKSLLKEKGELAIALIREKGLFYSQKIFDDPLKGFLALDESGLHVIGFTKNGIVFLDNSHQMKSGMDISDILDHDGNRLLPRFLDAAAKEGMIIIDEIWPNPATHEVSRLVAWCGMLGEKDIVCTLCWPDAGEGKK